MADRRRARNLDPSVLEWIVQLLDGWSTELTWQRLIDTINERLGVRYTRQALAGHESLALAFASRKRDLRVGRKSVPKDLSVDHLLEVERISRLEATVIRLRRENDLLRERFVVWAYNAHVHGVDEKKLNKPLPPIDRGPTVSGYRLHKAR